MLAYTEPNFLVAFAGYLYGVVGRIDTVSLN